MNDFDHTAVPAYCKQAQEALRASDPVKTVEFHHQTNHGMKVSIGTEAEIRAMDILFTGEPNSKAHSTPDHYFLSFYTLDQVEFVKRMKTKYPTLHDTVVAMKAAAAGGNFKGYFIELICINHFESEGIADAMTVAHWQLLDRKVRSVVCPITSSKVHVGATEDKIAILFETLQTQSTACAKDNLAAAAAAARLKDLATGEGDDKMDGSAVPVKLAGIVIFRRLPVHEVEYLLVQSLYGAQGWTPPKGHFTGTETALNAAKRSTRDESGLEETTGYILSQEAPLFYTQYWDAHRRCPSQSSYYLAEYVEGAPVTLGKFVARFEWLSAQRARERMGWVEMRQLIDKAELCLHRGGGSSEGLELPKHPDNSDSFYGERKRKRAYE